MKIGQIASIIGTFALSIAVCQSPLVKTISMGTNLTETSSNMQDVLDSPVNSRSLVNLNHNVFYAIGHERYVESMKAANENGPEPLVQFVCPADFPYTCDGINCSRVPVACA
jgi:hypothetical protein